ncbi:MAG: hypothetical protein HOP16_02935 [Acidobacteria bacterium]|nr:hypothetical protein [Acidobacteriota bacterium]
MNTVIATGIATCLCAALSAAAGQAPVPAGASQRAVPATQTAVMLSGCLYRKGDMPGRAPNLAEKPGGLEGYTIADARVVGQGSSAPGPEAGTGGRMYNVEGLPDGQLKGLVGKRVEVSGRIDAGGESGEGGLALPGRNPTSRGTIDLSEFEATSIREVAGGTACVVKPATAAR